MFVDVPLFESKLHNKYSSSGGGGGWKFSEKYMVY